MKVYLNSEGVVVENQYENLLVKIENPKEKFYFGAKTMEAHESEESAICDVQSASKNTDNILHAGKMEEYSNYRYLSDAISENVGWNIPTLKQLNIVCKFLNEINTVLQKSGKEPIKNNSQYWSSTPAGKFEVWTTHFYHKVNISQEIAGAAAPVIFVKSLN